MTVWHIWLSSFVPLPTAPSGSRNFLAFLQDLFHNLNMQKAFLIFWLLCNTANPFLKGARVTPETYNLIRHHEKLVLKAYPDIASPRARYYRLSGVDDPSLDGTPWTVGYGCTGSSIHEGTQWRPSRANLALERRVDRLAEALQASLTTEISQAQYDAIISFAYNVGSGVLKPGSRLMLLVNTRKFADVSRMLRRWTHAGGAQVAGLVLRRQLESVPFIE